MRITLGAWFTDLNPDKPDPDGLTEDELRNLYAPGVEVEVLEIEAVCPDLGCCEVWVHFRDPRRNCTLWGAMYLDRLTSDKQALDDLKAMIKWRY